MTKVTKEPNESSLNFDSSGSSVTFASLMSISNPTGSKDIKGM